MLDALFDEKRKTGEGFGFFCLFVFIFVGVAYIFGGFVHYCHGAT